MKFLIIILFTLSVNAKQPVPQDLNVHVVTRALSEPQIKKVLPKSTILSQRKLASTTETPHPSFIFGLIEDADLRQETAKWDQLEFDMFFLRASKYELLRFVNYYKDKKVKISERKLIYFWSKVREVI